MLEQEHVRKILASAAMGQSEWSEDDDSNEDGQDQDCPQGPLLGSNIRWGANSILV